MLLNFEIRDPSPNDTPATYGDIDWLARRRASERQRGVGSETLWLLVERDDGTREEQQITQNECVICLTTGLPNEPTDNISLQDTSDGTWARFFRYETPRFSEVVRYINPFATLVITPEPTPLSVLKYQEREDAAMDNLGELLSQGDTPE